MVAVQAETVVEEPLMGPVAVALADIMVVVVTRPAKVVMHQTQLLWPVCPKLVVMAAVAAVARVKVLVLALVVG
jgi:hypothetical protein